MTDYEALYAEQAAVCGAPFSEYVQFFNGQAPGKRVLDLGCGQGRDALSAARSGHSVIGVDLSPSGVQQMVAAADAEGLSVTGVVADVAQYEPAEAFDVIVIDRVLHMLASDDLRGQVLARMTRHVQPGGHLLIADTPANLPLIREVMTRQRPPWTPTLARKGFLFWQKEARANEPTADGEDQ